MFICPYCSFNDKPFIPSELCVPPLYGTPFNKCKKCRKLYYDENYEEPFLVDFTYTELLRSEKYHLKTTVGIAVFACLIMLFSSIWNHQSTRVVVFFWIAFFLCLGELGKYKKCSKRIEYVEREYLLSKERCSDPVYLQDLAVYNYPFSFRYLRSNPNFWRWLSYYKKTVELGATPVDYDPERTNFEWDVIEQGTEVAKRRLDQWNAIRQKA